MVGKTQVNKSSCKSKENLESVAAAEYSYLRSKNQELAKVLAQTKTEYTQIVAERDHLQRELLTAHLQIKKLENCLGIIENATKSTFNKIVGCSSDITKALQTVNFAKKIAKRLEDASNTSFLHSSFHNNSHFEGDPSPSQQAKTHAVKPMVGGHVILRPTINLRRVNEIPREEIERQYANPSTQRNLETEDHSTNNTLSEEVGQEQEPQQNSSFRCRSTASYRGPSFSNSSLLDDEESLLDMEDEQMQNITNQNGTENENSRLQTLQEVDEISEPSNQFDMEASLPNQNLNGTNPQDLLIGLFTGVQLYAYNGNQNLPQIVGNVSRNLSCLSQRNDSTSHTQQNSSENERNSHDMERVQMVTTNRGTGTGAPVSSQTEISSNISSFANESNNATILSQRNRRNDANSCTDNNAHVNSNNGNESICTSMPSTSGMGTQNSTLLNEQSQQKLVNSPRNNSTIISASSNNRFDGVNPLEGPSTLLDDLSATDILKLGQMSMLGLEPVSMKNKTSTPCSPVVKLRKKNFPPKISETMNSTISSTESVTDSTMEQFSESSSSNSTPRVQKTRPVRNKLINGKKQIIIGNPKVILKRLIITKRTSLSPENKLSSKSFLVRSRQSNTDDSDSTPIRKSKRTSDRMRQERGSKSGMKQTPKRTKSRKGSSKTVSSSRKTNSQSKGKRSEINLLSPKRITDSPIRPRRQKKTQSLKEPSLIKKLRRSK